YVWWAEIVVGTDQRKVAMVSAPRAQSAAGAVSAMPMLVRKNFIYAQEQPILDAALLEISGGTRLLVLDPSQVAVFRQQSGRWEPETSLAIVHTHVFPRNLRGRIFLRRDHLFDVYLPGTSCRSSATAPLTLVCTDND